MEEATCRKRGKGYRIPLMVIMLCAAFIITYIYHGILNKGTVFTHLFYIPIITASLWWKRKGLLVAALLCAVLFLSHGFMRLPVETHNDYLRGLAFLCIGFVVAQLSTKISESKEELRRSEDRYRTIFETTGTATAIAEEDTTISLANREFEKLSGCSKGEIEGNTSWTDFFHKEDIKTMMRYHKGRRASRTSAQRNYEARFIDRKKNLKDVYLTVDMIPGTNRSVVSILDMSKQKQAEREREVLQKRLATALTRVLSGFITICANCKKIRNEKEQWVQIESYLGNRTEAKFSHGICPECGKKLYGDFYKEK